MNILLLFGVFFVLIMLSVPIGVALGVATSLISLNGAKSAIGCV